MIVAGCNKLSNGLSSLKFRVAFPTGVQLISTMAACKNLPELRLNVVEDQNDVFRLLEVIKPTWNKDQVTIKVLSGGYSCCMLCCSHTSGDAVTVRVRNLAEGLLDPTPERQVLKVLSSKGYFPPVLALFQNGICYEYVQGNTFVTKTSSQLIITEVQLRLIAEKMACVHSVVVPEFDYTKSAYFDFFLDLLSTAKPWFEGCPDFEELREEHRIVKDLVSSAVESPLVTCHGDAQAANFVWNEEEQKVTFVDWEGSKVAPRGVDIAYVLMSADVFGFMYHIPVSTPPDREKKFCKHYLEQWNKLFNKPPPTTDELEQLLREFKYYKLMVTFVWVIAFVRFDTVFSEFGPAESGWKFHFGRYLNAKEELLGFKTLGPSPK